LADTFPRVKFGAHLANDDISGPNHFAAEFLDAASLSVGIAAVSARTLTLFMCHFVYSKLDFHRYSLVQLRNLARKPRFLKRQ
jgi:hypothetical protein